MWLKWFLQFWICVGGCVSVLIRFPGDPLSNIAIPVFLLLAVECLARAGATFGKETNEKR